MSLFNFKKKQKEEPIEIKKESLIKDLIIQYILVGYSEEQINEMLIKKGYPMEFIKFILNRAEKEVKNMVKEKKTNEDYGDEDEEEFEEDEEEEYEEEVPKPVKKEFPKKELRRPIEDKRPTPQAQTKTQVGIPELIQAIHTLDKALETTDARIQKLESSLFRSGVRV